MIAQTILCIFSIASVVCIILLYREYRELKTENAILTMEKNDLLRENQDLLGDVTLYESEADRYEVLYNDLAEKIYFYEQYVVVVEDDGTNLYHRYGCSHFKGEYFWAYNVEAAIDQGYAPCAKCGGFDAWIYYHKEED